MMTITTRGLGNHYILVGSRSMKKDGNHCCRLQHSPSRIIPFLILFLCDIELKKSDTTFKDLIYIKHIMDDSGKYLTSENYARSGWNELYEKLLNGRNPKVVVKQGTSKAS